MSCEILYQLPAMYLQVFPVELTRLPLLEKLYLDNNKLALLPAELGELRSLKVLRVDYNMLASVPGTCEMSSLVLFRDSLDEYQVRMEQCNCIWVWS